MRWVKEQINNENARKDTTHKDKEGRKEIFMFNERKDDREKGEPTRKLMQKQIFICDEKKKKKMKRKQFSSKYHMEEKPTKPFSKTTHGFLYGTD